MRIAVDAVDPITAEARGRGASFGDDVARPRVPEQREDLADPPERKREILRP